MSEPLPPLPEGYKLAVEPELPPLPPGYKLAQKPPTDAPLHEPDPAAQLAAVGPTTESEARRTPSWIEDRIDAAARSAPTAPVVDGQPFGPIIPNYKTHEEQARADALRAASPPGTLSEQLLNDYVKIVTRHPGLQVWTDQNIKHAAKLVPEADKLTSYEYLISGGWASTRDVYGRDTGGQFWIPPVWASAPLSAVLGIMSGMLAAVGESPDSAPGSTGADVQDLATEPVPGATTGPRKFVAGALSGATTVALAAPLGPGAAAGFFGLLGVGHLRDYMEPWVQAGTLPAWKRDLFAAAGGLGAGLIQSFGFGALMKGLQPLAPQAVQSAKNLGAGVLLDLLRRPSMVDVVGSWARSTAHGLVGLTTSALTDEITHALATGKKIDYENVYEAGRSALELGLVLGGVGAGREYLDRLGRWHEAQHDAATIAGVAAALKDSGFAKAHPDEAREVFSRMMGGQKYVFLDPNELAKVVPQHVADFIIGRDGSLADALLTGTKVPVKVDRLLVDHADIAEAMAKHATMHADGSTAKEVGNKPPLIQDLFAELQKALGVEVKATDEHKNLNLRDTLKGISDTLDDMRTLAAKTEAEVRYAQALKENAEKHAAAVEDAKSKHAEARRAWEDATALQRAANVLHEAQARAADDPTPAHVEGVKLARDTYEKIAQKHGVEFREPEKPKVERPPTVAEAQAAFDDLLKKRPGSPHQDVERISDEYRQKIAEEDLKTGEKYEIYKEKQRAWDNAINKKTGLKYGTPEWEANSKAADAAREQREKAYQEWQDQANKVRKERIARDNAINASIAARSAEATAHTKALEAAREALNKARERAADPVTFMADEAQRSALDAPAKPRAVVIPRKPVPPAPEYVEPTPPPAPPPPVVVPPKAVPKAEPKAAKLQPMLDKRYRSGNYRKEWAATKADAVPLDQLNEVKRQHETSLRQAQREVEKLTAQSASEQGKATAAAQKGVELGVEAAQVGRTAADVERANISSEQEWAAAKRRKLRKLGPTIDRLSATEMVQESSTRLQKKAEDQSVKATGKEISAAEKMKEAQRANNLRDNAKALTDALEKRRKEGLKLAEHVADMADDDVRASLYKAGQQYGTAYDKIMEAIGAREPDGRTPFNTDLRVLKGWNPDITFDPQEVQQILDRKAAFGDLNIKDAKIVHDALRNLREVAKNASDVYIAGERVKRDQMIGEMASALKARGLLPNKFTTGSPEKESKLKGIFGVSKEMQGRFALWEPFGEQGTKINEEASRIHLEASRIHAQWDRQVKAAFTRVQQAGIDPAKSVPMMDLDRSDAAPLSLRNYPKELPLSSVWHMQLLAGSESGMDALSKAFRKSPAEIDAFLAKHINTREQLEYLQQIWDANEAIGDLAAKAHERREGIGFEKVKKRPVKRGEMEFDGGYSGLRYEWDPERKTVIPGNLADAYTQAAHDRSDSPHYFTIERVPNTSGRIPQLSWSSMEANHRAVIHDAVSSDFARDLSRLIEDPAFRSVTAQYLGKNHLDQLKGWAQTEVVGSTPIISEGIGTSEALLRGATRLQGRGVFAFNLPVVASQLSHLQIAKSFLGLSEESMSVGVAKALDPARWLETRALSSGVDFRAEHFFAGHREMFDQISGVATGPLMSQVDKAGRGLTFMMDRFLSNAIFEAQLYHYQKEGATFAEATKKANAGLERVMPPLQMQDQSAFARNHRLLGMWVLVKNFPLAVGNMYAIDQWRAAAEQGAGRNALLTKLDHGATTLGIVGGLAMGALLAGRGRNQQEQDSGAAGLGLWMGRTLTEEAFYHNPIGSLVAREVAPMFWNHLLPSIDALGLAPGRREMGTSGIPALQLLDSLGRDAQDLISDEKPNDEKAFALLHGLGALTGFPPPAPLRGVKGAWLFINGTLQHSTPDNALGFLGTAVYGDRATTNIPTELGGLVQ